MLSEHSQVVSQSDGHSTRRTHHVHTVRKAWNVLQEENQTTHSKMEGDSSRFASNTGFGVYSPKRVHRYSDFGDCHIIIIIEISDN